MMSNEMNFVGFISFTLITTGKMDIKNVILSSSWPSVLSWPRGAPRCDIRPGHGVQTPDNLNVAVNKMGPGEWKVSAFLAQFQDKENTTIWQITVPGSFKGIILNSATEGRDIIIS